MNNSLFGAPLPDWKPATLPPREIIRGQYCQIAPLEADDAARLWPLIADVPALFDYLPYGPFDDETDFSRWIAGELARPDVIFHAICDLDGAPLGLCAYLRVDLANGSVEIGNVLYSPQLQRTRAATEAMFLLMRAVFQNGFRRYEWKCNSHNEPSKCAAKRLGFTYEGRFRQAAVVKGRNRDTDWFSLLDSEWPARETAFANWLAPANFAENGAQLRRLEELRTPENGSHCESP